MFKLIRSSDFALGASAAAIVVVSGLVGQYAARGMSGQQWFYGLTAIAGAITLAVILRCWPAPQRAKARVRIDE
jgi:chromate transport protein ChrA